MDNHCKHAIYITPYVPMAHGLGNERRAWEHLQGLKINQRKVSVILLDWGQRLPANNLKQLIDQTSGLLRLNCKAPNQRSWLSLVTKLLKSCLTRRYHRQIDKNSLKKLSQLVDKINPDLIFCFKRQAGLVWQQLIEYRPNLTTNVLIDLDTLSCAPTFNELKIISQHYNTNAAICHYYRCWLWRNDEYFIFRKNKNIIVSSSLDASLLSQASRHCIIDVIPRAVPVQQKKKKYDAIVHILFVANLSNYINSHAITYFCRHVWPLIQRAIGVPCQVDIIGYQAQDSVLELTEINGIVIWQDMLGLDVLYRQATLAICPVQFGHGSRTKVLEAMSYAIPVVTTSIGAQGIDLTTQHDLLIGDTAQEFAIHCIRLIDNENYNITVGENGHYLVKQRYSNYGVQQQLSNLIASII